MIRYIAMLDETDEGLRPLHGDNDPIPAFETDEAAYRWGMAQRRMGDVVMTLMIDVSPANV
jgi:hypothetical protein